VVFVQTSASKVAVAKAYFSIWTDTAPAAIAAVNEGFLVDPDGIANNGDEWQGGFLSPLKVPLLLMTV